MEESQPKKQAKMTEELGITPSAMKVPSPEQRAAFSAHNLARANGPKNAEWQLYYWPSLLGRGEYVRLMLAEAGQEWHEVALEEGGVKEVLDFLNWEEAKEYNPCFAPPIIRNGTFCLGETGAICQYLGRKFGLSPTNEEDFARACQLTMSALDFTSQARLNFHVNVNKSMSYYDQVAECRPFVENFREKVLPDYLGFFERILSKSGSAWFVANAFSFADIVIYHAVWVLRAQCPEHYAKLSVHCPNLVSFMDRVAARPKIAAYLEGPRRGVFNGDSFM